MIFIMASGLAPNIGAQLVFRFLAGFSGASPLVCAGGSLSDMFTPLEKTYMFPLFGVGGFGGPPLGPVMGAWIAQSPNLHSWRWTEWVALLTAAVIFFLAFFFQPETYAPVLLSWKAKQLRKVSGDDRYYAEHEINRIPLSTRLRIALTRPFVMAFREPVIILTSLYMTVLYIVLFTFLDGYEFIFTQTYGISQGLTNTIFVGIFVGSLTFTGSIIAFFKLRGFGIALTPGFLVLPAVLLLSCDVVVCFLHPLITPLNESREILKARQMIRDFLTFA